jgi:hypothetical protein
MIDKLESISMSKRAITRLFAVAVAFAVAGFVTAVAVGIAAIANGAVSLGGPQVVSLNPGAVAGAVAGLTVASLLSGIGTVAAVVSWAAALLNTARLPDKTWFAALLGLGVVSLGWVAMLAYVFAGPNGNEPIQLAAAAQSQG